MKKNYDKMTDQDIRIAMLEALRSEDLAEGRRLQKARHKLIDFETAVQHELIDKCIHEILERFADKTKRTQNWKNNRKPRFSRSRSMHM